MNKVLSEKWKNQLVGEVFKAMVSHEALKNALIFKGARILNIHLGTERQSLDIDSNFLAEFVDEHPDLNVRKSWLENHIEPAVRNYFENQDPVRFQLQSIKVKKSPPRAPHERGWDGLVAEIKVRDELHPNIPNFPNAEIEIAAPELLGANAVTSIALDGFTMRAYTLQRIAGEKLRAFLTSLPAYRKKMKGGNRAPRVKDLHDLARILEARPIEKEEFWREASEEFILACKSRYVDCTGLETFQEAWDVTRQAYETDANLPSIPFHKAKEALQTVVRFFQQLRVFPLVFEASEDL
jgi:hypothetical protein